MSADEQQIAKSLKISEENKKMSAKQLAISAESKRLLVAMGEELKKTREVTEQQGDDVFEQKTILAKNFALAKQKASEPVSELIESVEGALGKIAKDGFAISGASIGALAGGVQGGILGGALGKGIQGIFRAGKGLLNLRKQKKEQKPLKDALNTQTQMLSENIKSLEDSFPEGPQPKEVVEAIDELKVLQDKANSVSIVTKEAIDTIAKKNEELVEKLSPQAEETLQETSEAAEETQPTVTEAETQPVQDATFEVAPNEEPADMNKDLVEKIAEQNSQLEEMKESLTTNKLSNEKTAEAASAMVEELKQLNDEETRRESQLFFKGVIDNQTSELLKGMPQGTEEEGEEGGFFRSIFQLFALKLTTWIAAFKAKIIRFFAPITRLFNKITGPGGLFKKLFRMGGLISIITGAFDGLREAFADWDSDDPLGSVWNIVKETFLGGVEGIAEWIFGIPSLLAKGLSKLFGEDSNLGMFFNDLSEAWGNLPQMAVDGLRSLGDLFKTVLLNTPIIGDLLRDETPRQEVEREAMELDEEIAELKLKLAEEQAEFDAGDRGLFGTDAEDLAERKAEIQDLVRQKSELDRQAIQFAREERLRREAQQTAQINQVTSTNVQNNVSRDTKINMKNNKIPNKSPDMSAAANA